MPNQPIDHTTLITQLQTLPMLGGLTAANLAQFAQSALRRAYAPGAIIFLEGDPPPALFYVETGWVKAAKIAMDGREQILNIWGPGEMCGGIFVNRPAPATAIALETTTVWSWPSAMIRQLVARDPALALPMIEFMAERISELVELVADLSLHTVTMRVARLLLEQAEDNVVQRRRWATQAELAARLGTVPDVLSRALRELVEAKLIEVTRQQFRILDPQGLAAKTTPNA